MDTLVQQERKHLELVVDRIVALEPDVVLCERRVARLAQDMLLQRGVSCAVHACVGINAHTRARARV
jgi:hypothetical protein